MGIPGLLVALKQRTRPANLREVVQNHQAVAVDASSWLHKSVYSIASHYVEHMDSLDERCIETATTYLVRRCHELIAQASVRRIYLVMDGQRCPLKAVTNQDREQRRQTNLKKARQLVKQGQAPAAADKYKLCIKVTDALTKAVMQRLPNALAPQYRARVCYIWAPYEADAQLVQLVLDGRAQAIVTEDSDVLVYCATARVTCPVIFKLDRQLQCSIVSMRFLLEQHKKENNSDHQQSAPTNNSAVDSILQLFAVREQRCWNKGVRLFVQACVLTGCDYAPNELDGIGVVNAFKQIRGALHKTAPERMAYLLDLLPSKTLGKITDKDAYELVLAKSEAVFYYHPVCAANGTVRYLNDPARAPPDRTIASWEAQPELSRFGNDVSFLGSVQATSQPPPRSLEQPTRPAHNSCHVPVDRKRTAETAELRPLQVSNSPAKKSHPGRFSKFAATATNKENQPRSIKSHARIVDVRFVKRTFPKDGSRIIVAQPLRSVRSKAGTRTTTSKYFAAATAAAAAVAPPDRHHDAHDESITRRVTMPDRTLNNDNADEAACLTDPVNMVARSAPVHHAPTRDTGVHSTSEMLYNDWLSPDKTDNIDAWQTSSAASQKDATTAQQWLPPLHQPAWRRRYGGPMLGSSAAYRRRPITGAGSQPRFNGGKAVAAAAAQKAVPKHGKASLLHYFTR